MKPLRTLLLSVLLLAVVLCSHAQPFTLDDKIKPVKLEIREDSREGHEGEKGIVYFNRLTDSTMYHFVTGHDLYEFVDVLVTSIDGSPLQVSLAKDNWNAENEKQNTASAKDGIVNFKIRTWGSFGIKIETENPNNSLYNITVIASPPQKTHLGSAFRKIKKNEMESDGNATDENLTNSSDNGNNSNIILYIALGVALLVIGLLAGKLIGKKGKNTTVILLFIFIFPFSSNAQSHQGGNVMTMEQFENWKTKFEHDQQMLKTEMEILKKEREGMKKSLKNLDKTLSNIRKTWNDAKKLIDVYKNGLGPCINSTPPAGSPTIPSICTDFYFEDNGEISEEQDSECAGCFLEARRKFNNIRYSFEKLATIYKCTKDFSDAAISFGDNVSGFTPSGVSGLAWQTQRRNIEKSILELEQAYDKKYAQFIGELADIMMELNICEAKYGVEDWYDRFGFMYFEFMKDKYARTD